MSKVFDPTRARSSVDALEMICRQHPETAVNATALREELAAADEQINQLARALREAVEPPTFMGEPVSLQPVAYASSKPERINQLLSIRQYRSCLPKNRVDFDIPLYAAPSNVRAALERLLCAEEKYVRDTGLPQPDDFIQEAVNHARALLGWPPVAQPSGETEEQRGEVCAAWNDLPESLRCHPGLKRLYRALGGIRRDGDGVKGGS